MKYKIFGHCLKIETNDDVIINTLRIIAGHFANSEMESIGTIRFVKVSVTNLKKDHFFIDEMITTSSYVQPTKEYSTIYRSYRGERAIHFYEQYYLIDYLFDLNLVEFYYTDRMYSIINLLGEFLKYYIFEKAIIYNKYPLHSSCVAKKGSNKCVIFVGDSGCGKSSNAIFATLNSKFEFMNDEITYITYRGNCLEAISTTDKFKVCEPMFVQKNKHMKLNLEKSQNQYICDFLHSIDRENKVLDIVCVVALVRDDNANFIEKNCLTKLQLYALILRNLHLSVYSTKQNKLAIIECANKILKECKIISVRYPTKLIREVTNQILTGGIV